MSCIATSSYSSGKSTFSPLITSSFSTPAPTFHSTPSFPSTASFPSTSTFPSSAFSSTPSNVGANGSSESPIDSLITEIISVVTLEDSPLCRNCEEGACAFSKCIDCSELLCDTCVLAHQRVRLTKDHQISKFTSSNISKTACGSGGSSSQVSLSPCNNPVISMCESHRKHHSLFCQTCIIPACAECVQDHPDHDMNYYIDDSNDTVKTTTQKLTAEICQAITAIREGMDSVQRMSENVELRCIQAATEARNVMKRYKTALEAREIELLKRIDQARQIKGKQLMSQAENLRLAFSKLTCISDLLSESADAANNFELMAINERAAIELKQIRALRLELMPCEDDGIMFLPPDTGFLSAISSVGNLTINYSSLMPSRAVRAPVNVINKEPHMYIKRFHENKDEPSRNRPIYGANHMRVTMDNGEVPTLTFGIEGEGDGQFCRPWGVCCDHLGHIIVADRSNNRIQIFGSNGNFLYKFGSKGTGPGQFDRPAGITINPQGNIVVADKDNHRIQVFKMDGTFVLTFGEKGARSGQFNYPWDVACNSLGHIIVSDTRNHRIQLFTSEGVFLNKYGFEGATTMWKHFDAPRGVCFTPNGDIIITDFNNHRLVFVDKHLLHAQYLGQEGSKFKQFSRPQGIICDDDGRIIVADSKNHRIQVIESNGNFLSKVGLPGRGLGELDRPSGICLNPDGRIVVVDFGNNRVQVF